MSTTSYSDNIHILQENTLEIIDIPSAYATTFALCPNTYDAREEGLITSVKNQVP